ncbi:hypothetical protein C8D76_10414 [Pasteurella langaaensis DSM 22999]|uniref:NfeD-like C-terminal domain-containing protein n=1 Tax=Alitibacter langaaensis DSM 22999 TaxID=1122935 RepID=A0A2U0T866_9PAST|nr:NfeD family protein [Pasteurella langaaensis]PVX39813.1 hypothetical protein C8D76_10414 [Pasteurella langaaensis DSM 22999]
MEWLSTWDVWHWLMLGFGLLIAEIIVPGIFLLWWGLSALVVAGLMALFPALSFSTLSFIFAILAIFLSLIWWKYQRNRDYLDDQKTALNQRDHAMIGAKGIVEEVSANGIGRGRFGDTTWRIKGERLQIGDTIQVQSVQGITLNVKNVL